MAPSVATANNNGKHPTKSAEPRPADYSDVDGSPGIGDWVANAIVLVITWPILFISKILNAFVERGGAGIQALGAVAFCGGVLAGADNYYQGFTGKALLPWYTKADWVGAIALENPNGFIQWLSGVFGGQTIIGWGAVILSIFSFGFLIALAFSLLTQFIQGQAVRGRSLRAAKAEFEQWNEPTVPEQPDPNKKLDMAVVTWKEYKRTGKRQRGFIGFISISLWVIEFIAAFSAHNPMNYTGQAGQFIACTIYALVTIAAGEIGYNIYCSTKDEVAKA